MNLYEVYIRIFDTILHKFRPDFKKFEYIKRRDILNDEDTRNIKILNTPLKLIPFWKILTVIQTGKSQFTVFWGLL